MSNGAGEGLRVVMVTAASAGEARRLIETLVGERLVACGNILPEVTSIYRWEGEVEEATEALIVLKTTDELVDQVMERIEALHQYETPEVIALPVTGVLGRYANWVRSETTEVES